MHGSLKRRSYNNLAIDAANSAFGKEHGLTDADMLDIFNSSSCRSTFKAAYDERYRWMKEHLKDRDLDVIFVEGGSGLGKTLFAIEFAKNLGMLYSLSSSNNDPLQDMLEDDDCFILNDVRDNTFTYNDFLKLTETYVNTSVKSRYGNKTFFGNLIIITSFKPCDQWYKNIRDLGLSKEEMEDKDFSHQKAIKQFNRRIHKLIKVKEAVIEIYKHFSDGHDELEQTIPNPAYLLDKEYAHVLHFGDNEFEKAASNSAIKLGVEEAYEVFKTQNVNAIQSGIDAYYEDKQNNEYGLSIDAALLVQSLVDDAIKEGIPKDILLQAVLDKIKGTQSW